MARILIVEDAKELLSLVAGFFESKGSFDVDTASDGNTALNLLDSNDYDIAIVDIMIPGASRTDVCQALRSESKRLIVDLTAVAH